MKNILFVSHSAELNGAELWLLDTLKTARPRRLCSVLDRSAAAAGSQRPAKSLESTTRAVPMKWWITEKSTSGGNRSPGPGTRRASDGSRRLSDEKDRPGFHEFGGDVRRRQGGARKRAFPTSGRSTSSCGGANPLLHYLFGRRALV